MLTMKQRRSLEGEHFPKRFWQTRMQGRLGVSSLCLTHCGFSMLRMFEMRSMTQPVLYSTRKCALRQIYSISLQP